MNTVIAASLQLDGEQANNSVKSFKQQLKEASNELITIQEKFGATSKEALAAAKSVASLKDRMQEAKEVTDLFDPGKKFQVFGNVLRTTVGGVTALTGAMAMFGGESAEVQKTLLKVQGALALTEGVNTIVDSAKDFGRLKAVAVDALKGIKTAIGSTGIGLIVVAAGLLYAYWGDIKEAVTGSNSAQAKNLELTKKAADKEKEKLTHIDDQDNILKSQGKTEKQILELKEKQVQQVIAAEEAQLSAQKLIQKEQIETAQRNHDILEGILVFITAPLRVITGAVDSVLNAVGKSSNLTKGLDKGLSSAASLIFDPAETKKKADATNKEAEDGITKLKNQYAGYQNQIKQINKDALAKEKAFQAELKALRDAAGDALITDAESLAERKLKQDYENQRASILQETHTKEQRNQLLLALDEKYQNESGAVVTAKIKEVQDKLTALRNDEAAKRKQADADGLKDLLKSGSENLQAMLDINSEIANSRLDAAGQQYEADMAALNAWLAKKLAAVKGNAAAEGEINAEYERRKSELEEARNKQRLAILSSTLGQAAELFGKATVAGKAMAIAQTTIDTYQSATSSYKSLSGIPIVGPALGFAAAGVAIAAGLANVQKIMSVQTPGGSAGSGSMPSVSSGAPAPIVPTRPVIQTTQLPQDQINQIGNATVRAFVVESDITDKQERITRLSRSARLGG
jgi:hypothetical protein